MTTRRREGESLLSTPPPLWVIIISFFSLVFLASLFVTFVVSPQIKEGTAKPITHVTKATKTPKATPTPTATETTTTNPNVKPVPGSCLVLEERYCKTVTFVIVNGFLIAAFKLPAGTTIFSPYSGAISVGIVTDGVGGPKIPNMATFTTVKTWKKVDCLCGADILDVWYTGAIEGKKFVAGKISQISKGEILARTGGTNSIIKQFNEFNLTMNFLDRDFNPDNAKTKAAFGISQQK